MGGRRPQNGHGEEAGMGDRRARSAAAVAIAGVVALVPSAAAVAATPHNDDFSHPISLSRSWGQSRSTTAGATRQRGEPRHDGFTGGRSIWWRYVAPFDGRLQVTALSGTA